MYIINGIAYANEFKSQIEVTNVKLLEDGMLLLTFNTMERKLFDTTILQGPAFEPLKEEAVLNTVSLDAGVVTWLNGEIDCAPEYMYSHSYSYDEILV